MALAGDLPGRSNEVTGVTVRIMLQVVLVFRLCLPERTGRSDLRVEINSNPVVGGGTTKPPLGLHRGYPLSESRCLYKPCTTKGRDGKIANTR
jgi:hypothetical protein